MLMVHMMGLAAVALVLALLQAGENEAQTLSRKTKSRRLKIAAFNVQAFGMKKIQDDFVLKYVAKIINRYDVILIQEVRDKSKKAIRFLKKRLPQHNLTISQRLGRTMSKEQYAFFYRWKRVTLLDQFLYEDPDDVFEREPFVITIAPLFSPENHVSLIPLHSKPTDATAEIGNLTKVIQDVSIKHPFSEIIIMGDLNADCDYSNYRKRERANDFLTFHYDWLIGEGVDTTTKSTDCAYDRIIVQDVKKSFAVEDTAKIYNYTRWYRLNETQSLRISDHYPVEVQLQF